MPGESSEQDVSIGDVYRALADLGRLIDAIVADDRLTDAEVRFLAGWLDASRTIAGIPPANEICRRVHEVLSDGVITRKEKAQLLAELRRHVASKA